MSFPQADDNGMITIAEYEMGLAREGQRLEQRAAHFQHQLEQVSKDLVKERRIYVHALKQRQNNNDNNNSEVVSREDHEAALYVERYRYDQMKEDLSTQLHRVSEELAKERRVSTRLRKRQGTNTTNERSTTTTMTTTTTSKEPASPPLPEDQQQELHAATTATATHQQLEAAVVAERSPPQTEATKQAEPHFSTIIARRPKRQCAPRLTASSSTPATAQSPTVSASSSSSSPATSPSPPPAAAKRTTSTTTTNVKKRKRSAPLPNKNHSKKNIDVDEFSTRRGQKWTAKFEWMKEYKARFGHCNVSKVKDAPEYKELATFVSSQRTEFRFLTNGSKQQQKSCLTPARIRKLRSIGFAFSQRKYPTVDFDTRIAQLVAFRQENGHLRVPQLYESSGSATSTSTPGNNGNNANNGNNNFNVVAGLGNFVMEQRRMYRELQLQVPASECTKRSLTPERLQRLNAIGFEWILRNRGGVKDAILKATATSSQMPIIQSNSNDNNNSNNHNNGEGEANDDDDNDNERRSMGDADDEGRNKNDDDDDNNDERRSNNNDDDNDDDDNNEREAMTTITKPSEDESSSSDDESSSSSSSSDDDDDDSQEETMTTARLRNYDEHKGFLQMLGFI
jgi:hypothetical protein